MSKFAAAAGTAALMLCARPVAAAVVLDQSDVPETGIAFTNAEAGGNFSQSPLGQSFTVGIGGVLDHIDIGLVSLVTPTVPITISLLDNTGTELFASTYGGSAVPLLRFGQTRWENLLGFDVSPAKVRVTPGQVLRFKVSAPGASPVLTLAYQANNVFFSYAGGSSLVFNSLGGAVGAPTSSDYAFRTYVDTAPAVPEPSAWALMILGLGAGGTALRMRRRAVCA